MTKLTLKTQKFNIYCANLLSSTRLDCILTRNRWWPPPPTWRQPGRAACRSSRPWAGPGATWSLLPLFGFAFLQSGIFVNKYTSLKFVLTFQLIQPQNVSVIWKSLTCQRWLDFKSIFSSASYLKKYYLHQKWSKMTKKLSSCFFYQIPDIVFLLQTIFTFVYLPTYLKWMNSREVNRLRAETRIFF